MNAAAPALFAGALGLVAALTPHQSRAQSLDALVEEFGGGPALIEGVAVDARLDGPVGADGAGAVLITLSAHEGVRLVADPGFVVTPLDAGPWLVWEQPLIERIEPDQAYFERPQTVRAAFTTNGGGKAPLLVEYAYCLVDEICLFGEATVEVATSAAEPAP